MTNEDLKISGTQAEHPQQIPPPFLAAIAVPTSSQDQNKREKGYGFVTISDLNIKEHPDLISKLSAEQQKQLQAELRKTNGRMSLFLHKNSIDGYDPNKKLADTQIVPTEIVYDPEKRKFSLRAETKEHYMNRKEKEAADDKKRNDAQKLSIAAIHGLGLHLSEEEIQYAIEAATSFLPSSASPAEISTNAQTVARHRHESKQFDLHKSEYKEQALQTADQHNGDLREDEDFIEVVMTGPHEVASAYDQAKKMDENNAPFGKIVVGALTGAKILKRKVEVFGPYGGGDTIITDFTEEPNKPPDEAVTIFHRGAHTPSIDLTLEQISQIREGWEKGKKWIDIVRQATQAIKEQTEKQHVRGITEAMEIREAVGLLEKIISAHPLPSMDEVGSMDTTWLGFDVTAAAGYSQGDGYRKGGSFEQECYLTWIDSRGQSHRTNLRLPTTQMRESIWKDIRDLASQANERYLAQVPEGVIDPYETKMLAQMRLDGFVFDNDFHNLPVFPDTTWYKEVMGDVSSRQEFDKVPEDIVPGEWDDQKTNYFTHDLAIEGSGLDKPWYVGTLRYHRMKRSGKWRVQIVGYSNPSGNPKYEINQLLDKNPDIDPRKLKLRWVPVSPPKQETES